jgi:hypothetical protein
MMTGNDRLLCMVSALPVQKYWFTNSSSSLWLAASGVAIVMVNPRFSDKSGHAILLHLPRDHPLEAVHPSEPSMACTILLVALNGTKPASPSRGWNLSGAALRHGGVAVDRLLGLVRFGTTIDVRVFGMHVLWR